MRRHWRLLFHAISYSAASYVQKNVFKRRLQVFHETYLSARYSYSIDYIVKSILTMSNDLQVSEIVLRNVLYVFTILDSKLG